MPIRNRKISQSLVLAHKRKKWGFLKGQKPWHAGKKLPDYLRRKLSEIRKGKKLSEDTKRKISKALKGRVKSEEHRRKLSEANRGKFLSYEVREKISKALRGRYGSKNSSWKGGSLSYWKRAVKRRDGKCVKCGNDDPRVLTADHIKSKKMYPDLIYSIENGITLCHNCHAIKTFQDEEYRSWMSSNHWNKKEKSNEALF